MPTFIFTKTVLRKSKTYGTQDILCNIYEIKKKTERPERITFVEYNTASTPGAETEVFRKLIDIGKIPTKYYYYSKEDWRSAGYYCPRVEKAGYRIYEVY